MRYESLLHAIGNTPLVNIDFKTSVPVYAKLEYLNPSGSLKDRPALYMIEEAERNSLLKPSGTIIDASSGNYGISLAMIGAIKGHDVIICVPDRTSQEKQQAIKAYGAQLIVCPDTADLKDPSGYHTMAEKLHHEIPSSFMPHQYSNPANAHGHYQSLGREIWDQTEGKVTHFIAGAGTCGTLNGVGRYLKEQKQTIKIIGVDSPNSFRSTKGNPKPYKIEGIGVDLDSELLDYSIIDEFIEVSDKEAFSQVPILASNGFLAGLSSGAVACAVHKYRQQLNKNDYVVIIFGDSGRSYLTKVFSQIHPSAKHKKSTIINQKPSRPFV